MTFVTFYDIIVHHEVVYLHFPFTYRIYRWVYQNILVRPCFMVLDYCFFRITAYVWPHYSQVLTVSDGFQSNPGIHYIKRVHDYLKNFICTSSLFINQSHHHQPAPCLTAELFLSKWHVSKESCNFVRYCCNLFVSLCFREVYSN